MDPDPGSPNVRIHASETMDPNVQVHKSAFWYSQMFRSMDPDPGSPNVHFNGPGFGSFKCSVQRIWIQRIQIFRVMNLDLGRLKVQIRESKSSDLWIRIQGVLKFKSTSLDPRSPNVQFPGSGSRSPKFSDPRNLIHET